MMLLIETCVCEDIMNVINSISKNVKLFMAHQARYEWQTTNDFLQFGRWYWEHMRQIQRKFLKTLMIMDFKMKWTMKSNRETTTEYFTKRGTDWHRFVVIFYMLDKDNDPNKNSAYLDQVLSDTNKLDKATKLVLTRWEKN